MPLNLKDWFPRPAANGIGVNALTLAEMVLPQKCDKLNPMNHTLIPKTDAHILEAVVAPEAPTLSAPVAKAVVSLAFTKAQVAEIHRLLDKQNAETITARELSKLESYTRVGNFLNLLKAKARASLSRKSTRG